MGFWNCFKKNNLDNAGSDMKREEMFELMFLVAQSRNGFMIYDTRDTDALSNFLSKKGYQLKEYQFNKKEANLS